MGSDLKSIAKQLYESFNDRDWEGALRDVRDDVHVTIVPFGMSVKGREGFTQFMQNWVAMSSDLKVEVVDQHESDRGIVNEIIATGTHDGPFATPEGELASTGRSLEIPAAEIWEFRDGKVATLRNYVDAAAIWKQIVDAPRVEARIRAFYDEVANRGKIDLIPEYATDNWVDHEAFAGLSPGREGIGEFLALIRSAFPDVRFTVDEVLVAGDRAVCRVRISGTHLGEFMGAPPTGNSFEVQTIDILRMEGDRAAEHWGVTDMMSMMEQLGLAEPAETIG